MEIIAFNAEKRDMAVKAKVTRQEGKIPAVLYGQDVQEHFSVKHNDIKKLIFTPDFRVGEMNLDGAKHKCIVRDIQWHPVTDQISHIDFLALKEGSKIKVDIPVKFKGVSPGVKEGGALMQTMRRVKVKLDPKDLVDELFVDISELKLGDAIRVKDMDVPDGIEVLVNSAVPIATVEVPRALKSMTAEEATAAQDAPAAEEAPAEEAK